MFTRHRWACAVITAAAILVSSGTVRAHGGGGGHGGGGHGGGGFHGGGFHGGGFHGGGFHGGGFGHYGYGGYGYRGFGYGGYGYRGFGYGGFGYPFGYGLGLGFGLGYGLGYGGFGYGYGYPYGYGMYGYGYPYMYGGYGYPYAYGGYGAPYGYGAYGGYGYGYPSAGYGGYGYGNGFAYNYRPTYAPTPIVAASAQSRVVAPAPAPAVATTVRRPPTAGDFAQQGDDAFRSGNYTAASRAWQHAQIDEPNNGLLTLKVAQAQFASGQFNEAADAVQQAMATLPSTQWGSVVRNCADVRRQCGRLCDATQSSGTRRAESTAEPSQPIPVGLSLRVHGRSADATKLLDEDLKLAPQNATARALRRWRSAKFAPPLPEPRATSPVLSRKPENAAPRDVLDL